MEYRSGKDRVEVELDRAGSDGSESFCEGCSNACSAGVEKSGIPESTAFRFFASTNLWMHCLDVLAR
jgi:hypothetical protein